MFHGRLFNDWIFLGSSRGRCSVTVAYGTVDPLAGVRFPAAALFSLDKLKIGVHGLWLWAEVAKLGQRRKVEVLIT